MAEHQIQIMKNGYSVKLGEFTLKASGIIRDRDAIRVTLSVHKAEEIIFRDKVNLTGERSRIRVLKSLKDKDLEIADSIPECLLALDEAIRNTSSASSNGHKKTLHDTLVYFSETPPTLAELKAIWGKGLLIRDPHFLEVPLGAVKAHQLGGESPWLLINSPPSTLKTEIIRGLSNVPGIYPISDLTSRTMASGLETPGRETSLLMSLSNEILVLKDLTTVLEMRAEERQAVMSQLREIYDGYFDKSWGTGKQLHWQGRLGFIAGVTNIIDQHQHVMAVMGPRFLQFRVEQPEREEVAKTAMSNSQMQEEMRRERAGAIAQFLESLPTALPAVPDAAVSWLAKVADVVTRARSPVLRDGYRRELHYAPEPEGPARFAKQLLALLHGITLVGGRTLATPRDLSIVTRVAHDCIPKTRQVAVETLLAAPDGQKTSEIAHSAKYSTPTVRRALEDLQALGLVGKTKSGAGHPDTWWIEGTVRDVLKLVFSPPEVVEKTFSEKYDTVSYTNDPVFETGKI